MEKGDKDKNKKPLFKKWWFWLIAIVVIGIIVSSMGDKEESKDTESTGETENKTNIEEIRKLTEEEKNGAEPEIVLNLEDATEVDYIDLWNNYSDELHKGKIIKFTGKIDYIGKEKINIKEGLKGLTGSLHITPQNKSEIEKYAVGEMITVIGIVEQKLMGYLYVKNAVLDKASDDDLAMIDTYREKRQDAIEEEIKKYKSGAQSIAYERLIREPNKYVGEIITVKIKVLQIMGGRLFTDAGIGANKETMSGIFPIKSWKMFQEFLKMIQLPFTVSLQE